MSSTTPAPPLGVRDRLDTLVRRGVEWPTGRASTSARLPVPTGRTVGALRPVRPAAVLVLFGAIRAPGTDGAGGGHGGSGPGDVDVLLVERAASLGHHPGQVAFPGGRIDPVDGGPVDAALREATEETGLDAGGVDVVGTLAGLPLPVSNHVVTPVLGWWASPSPVGVVDRGECAAVFRVPVDELVDPANRRLARVTRGGRSLDSPAFVVGERIVWGFTGIVLDRVLAGLGWAVPWEAQVLDVPV